MTKELKKKEGLSPVIATVLLIAMVIVMGLIVFLWMRGSIKEVIYKFSDQNIELACADVSFTPEYTSATGNLYVVNNGDVPIKDFKVRVTTGGTKTTLTDIVFSGIASGNDESVDIREKIGSAEEILVIPILQGKTSSGTLKNYVCDEKYGEKIFVSSD